MKVIFILLSSLIFVYAGHKASIPYLLTVGTFGYLFARIIAQETQIQKRKLFLGAGILINLLVLIGFKLLSGHPNLLKATPITSNIAEHIITPLGISYVTFQIISYLIDGFRQNTIPEKNILAFWGYILFFPKLVSGPLVRYQPFQNELSKNIIPDTQNITAGMRRILFGISKRILIANQLAPVVNSVFNLPSANISPEFAWIALIAYGVQIYFDFSGYTDIALGIAQIIGIRLPENFNQPYTAQSISDFWRRWHISLSNWFREYVFYPLERHRLKFFGQQINLVLVFILTGLWHGITINFLLWGLIHGSAIALESAGVGRWLKSLWRPLRHFYTLSIVLFSWIFFRSPTPAFALEFIGRLAGNANGLVLMPFSITTPLPFIEPTFVLSLTAGILLCLPLQVFQEKFRSFLPSSLGNKYSDVLITIGKDIFAILLFVLAIAAQLSSGFTPNIYAQF